MAAALRAARCLVAQPVRVWGSTPQPVRWLAVKPGRQRKTVHTDPGQASPIETFIANAHVAVRQGVQAVRRTLVGDAKGLAALKRLGKGSVDAVYAFDDAVRAIVGRLWHTAQRKGGVSSAFRQATRQSPAATAKDMVQYYKTFPYETVYHLIALLLGVYALWFSAWKAAGSAPNANATLLGWWQRNLTLTGSHLAQGKVWTLATSPLCQVDYMAVAGNAAMLAGYGSKCVSYVGPWYTLQLAAAGTALSTAVFLGSAAAFDTPSAAAAPQAAPAPHREGFTPSTADGSTPGSRAVNVLTRGTHEGGDSTRPPPPRPSLAAPSPWSYPHIGPAGAIAAVAGFVVAARPAAAVHIFDLKLPLLVPLLGYTAVTAGSALTSPRGQALSDAAHLSGAAAGVALYAGLRSGRLPYSRFWPKA